MSLIQCVCCPNYNAHDKRCYDIQQLLCWHSSIYSLLEFSRNKPSLLIELILSLGFWCHLTPFEVSVLVTPQPVAECLWNILGFVYFTYLLSPDILMPFTCYWRFKFISLSLSALLIFNCQLDILTWMSNDLKLIYSELTFMTSSHSQTYLFHGLLHLTNSPTFIIFLKSVFQESYLILLFNSLHGFVSKSGWHHHMTFHLHHLLSGSMP